MAKYKVAVGKFCPVKLFHFPERCFSECSCAVTPSFNWQTTFPKDFCSNAHLNLSKLYLFVCRFMIVMRFSGFVQGTLCSSNSRLFKGAQYCMSVDTAYLFSRLVLTGLLGRMQITAWRNHKIKHCQDTPLLSQTLISHVRVLIRRRMLDRK